MKNKSAFTLFEVSVILLIIGIAIGVVLSTRSIIQKSRIANAQNQTANSPVKNMEGVFLWLDASSDENFIETEVIDTDQDSANNGISAWYDTNPISDEKRRDATSASTANNPHYYSSCIRGLPCLRFDGTNDYFSLSNITGIEQSDYSIFIVEQRRKDGLNPIIGHIASASNNAAITVGYSATNKVILAQGNQGSNYYSFTPSPSIGTYSDTIPRLHSFVISTLQAGTSTGAHYLDNGSSASSASLNGTFTGLSSYSDAKIGVDYGSGTVTYYQGDIGEIIIFKRPLKGVERRSVENYLMTKWRI